MTSLSPCWLTPPPPSMVLSRSSIRFPAFHPKRAVWRDNVTAGKSRFLRFCTACNCFCIVYLQRLPRRGCGHFCVVIVYTKFEPMVADNTRYNFAYFLASLRSQPQTSHSPSYGGGEYLLLHSVVLTSTSQVRSRFIRRWGFLRIGFLACLHCDTPGQWSHEVFIKFCL